ncbi:MAG: phosphatidylserine decarboxylase family protein [Desulfovibrio sp.]|jgi:phosphatidylserine decarboxylase|nr:phosphatidylserine decarboxylase family protein [Desulfovibrio sp.]
MLKAHAGITPEGRPAIFLCALAALLAALLDSVPAAILFFLLTFFCCNFFRDPERVVPDAPGLAVSPADGRIVKIASMPDPFSGEPRQCVCIFMDLFSVHVNRSPTAGKITNIAYHEGKFFNASLDKASGDNERCAYALEDEDGKSWSMVQIAGLVARRIVCRAEVGDRVRRGERIGMIKFGSRVDVYLPPGWQAKVAPGRKVLAGLSVIAEAEQKSAT